MKKAIKKVVCTLLTMAMLVCCVQVQPTEAKTVYTKAEINEKIKTLKADIKKLQKQFNKVRTKEEKAIASATYVSGEAVVKSTKNDYYIIADENSGMNYLVYNTKYIQKLSGKNYFAYVKETGRRVNAGYMCLEAKAIQFNYGGDKLEDKIIAKQERLQKYQNAKKEKITVKSVSNSSDFWDSGEYGIAVGDKATISYKWTYGGYYNKVTFSSSDKSVATVNASGVITAKKPGTVTITAKCSCSGKKTKLAVRVIEPLAFQEDSGGSVDVSINGEDSWGEVLQYEFHNSGSDLTITADNPALVAVEIEEGNDNFYDSILYIRPLAAGTTTVTVSLSYNGTRYDWTKTITITDLGSYDDDDDNYSDDWEDDY